MAINIPPSTLGIQRRNASLLQTLQADLSRTRQEVVTFRKQDVAAEGPGRTAQLLDLRSRFERIETDSRSIGTFLTRAGQMQQSIVNIDTAVTEIVTTAATGVQSLSDPVRVSLQTTARAALDELTSLLNTAGDRFLFGGIETGTPPMQKPDEVNGGTGFSPLQVIADAFTATPPVDAASAATLNADLDAIFAGTAAAGTNYEETFYNGAPTGSPPLEARLGDGTVVGYEIQANDPAVRDIMQALYTFASFDPAAIDPAAYPVMMQHAFDKLTQGMDALRQSQADLGGAEQLAVRLLERNGATKTLLNKQIVDLEQVDPAESRTRMLDIETQLTLANEMTARLSRFSLVNFLR